MTKVKEIIVNELKRYGIPLEDVELYGFFRDIDNLNDEMSYKDLDVLYNEDIGIGVVRNIYMGIKSINWEIEMEIEDERLVFYYACQYEYKNTSPYGTWRTRPDNEVELVEFIKNELVKVKLKEFIGD